MASRVTSSSSRATNGSRHGQAIVDPANFLLATRDSGYKSTALAIAELVDNSVQAQSSRVNVRVEASELEHYPIRIEVADDGSGMDERTLSDALTFGGSNRFGDRSSLGRYGMGLPNGGLSQARRIEVYTWRDDRVLTCALDLDELIAKRRRTLPPVSEVDTDLNRSSPSGTVVRLLKCDRVGYRQPASLARRLTAELGRIFRTFIDEGLELAVNDETIRAIHPLMLDDDGRRAGVVQFGDVLRYEFDSALGVGSVEVRFSELPIERWHGLSTKEKRDRGVTGVPPVSVLRCGREIDCGWFFMGGKRRENYDDWWRCEVRFEPVLDEHFGITNAKQAISPSRELSERLSTDLEPIARALNARVRHRFEIAKLTTPLSAALKQAVRAEESLPRIRARSESLSQSVRRALAARGNADSTSPYEILIADLPTPGAFEAGYVDSRLVLALNSRHPLYRDLYRPLAESESARDQQLAKGLVLTVLAAARAEYLDAVRTSRRSAREFQRAWSDVVATFMGAEA